MSGHPSLNAALKRLRRWTDLAHPKVYQTGVSNPRADLVLVLDAMTLVTDCAEHTDDADAQPIFTVRLPCIWTAADKGFLHALNQCRGKTWEDVG